MDIDDLIGREGVRRPCVSDVGQDHVFAQAGLDQLDDILNTGWEARRRLGQAIDGRCLQQEAGNHTRDRDVMLKFEQTPAKRRDGCIQVHVSDTFHLYNLAHLVG
jgi:hypothetical protein